MLGNVPFGVASATEITRHQCQRPPSNDTRVIPLFGAVAKLIWPSKTSAHLATIAKTSERHAARWLSGEFEPPAIIIAAIIVEITKRE